MDEITIYLPERNSLGKAGHLCSVMRQSRSSDDGGIIILSGVGKQTCREAAAAAVFARKYLDYEIPEREWTAAPQAEESVDDKARKREMVLEELEKLIDPSPMWKETADAGEADVPQKAVSVPLRKKQMEICLAVDTLSVEIDPKENNRMLKHSANYNHFLKNTSDAILIEGSILSDVEEETYHVLEVLNERRGDRILVVALDGMSQNMINKLVFDYDAANLTVPVPKKKYYEERFMDSMEQEGAVLAEGTSVEKIVDMIRCFRAEEFGLNDFGKAIKKAVRKAAKEERQELVYRDFELFQEGYQEPEERLEELIGLGKVKKKVARMAALRMFDDARLGPFHKHASYHVAFAGDPGTGKTEVARLYAQMLSKNGITNGIFISACKSDYIGIHVGKTADLMYKLFTRARNGVIFFDEAATFLTDDSFAEEALTELVRFMEMYTDVVCIFASYEDNINKLLEKDAGLKSRISEIIKFDNYSKEELYDILSLFCQKEQFQLEDARAAFYRYVEDQRRAYPDSFGNARLSRNVFNKAKEILAKETIESGKDPELVNTMTAELIDKALEELTAMSAVRSRNHFGFAAL